MRIRRGLIRIRINFRKNKYYRTKSDRFVIHNQGYGFDFAQPDIGGLTSLNQTGRIV
jgi:hypothetical protein